MIDRRSNGFGRMLTVILLLLIAVSLAAMLGRHWWGFELVTHFTPQLAAVAGVLVVVFLVRWSLFAATVSVALLAVHAWPLVPYILPDVAAAQADPASRRDRDLRIITMNLRRGHADVAAVHALIRRERPDVVVLTEFLASHAEALRALDDVLPHRVATLGSGFFEIMLLSRMPVVDARRHYPLTRSFPVLEARLCDDDVCITVLGLHPPHPPGKWTKWRDTILTFAALRAAEVENRCVAVVGDLNTTPWSPSFDEMLRIGGPIDAALGSPFRSTWLSRVPLFGLSIDHVLVGRGLAPLARRVGDGIGSDHLPVVVDLAVRGGGRIGACRRSPI